MDSRTLNQLVVKEMEEYAGEGFNGVAFFFRDDVRQLYTVIDVGEFMKQRIVDVDLLVHIEDDYVVIEHDANDKPLVDALVQAGVPRTQIILVYDGEKPKTTIPLLYSV